MLGDIITHKVHTSTSFCMRKKEKKMTEPFPQTSLNDR